jgi:uncharacterized protein (UPF0210 family)
LPQISRAACATTTGPPRRRRRNDRPPDPRASVGLDTIAIPGGTPSETIAAIIADEAAIGMINKKTTAGRLIPAVGKDVGDWVDFGGLLGRAPIVPVNTRSSRRLIARGGRIPSPLQALIN